MKFRVYIQTNRNRYVLFGFIFEWKVRAWEYDSLGYANPPTRTTIAFIPPSKNREGVSSKVWGYDKVHTPKELIDGGEK